MHKITLIFAAVLLAIPAQANPDLEACMQNEWCRNAYGKAKKSNDRERSRLQQQNNSPTPSRESRLYTACQNGTPADCEEYLRFLSNKGSRDNETGRVNLPKKSVQDLGYIINSAIQKNDLAKIKVLLDNGMNPDADHNGVTALYSAAYKGHAEIAKVLLSAGADVNAAGNSGKTALMLATREGHDEIAKLLLSAGANPNKKDKYGRTALIYAARAGNAEVAEVLLSLDVNLNVEDNDGWTALYLATREGHDEIAEMLLSAGVDAMPVIIKLKSEWEEELSNVKEESKRAIDREKTKVENRVASVRNLLEKKIATAELEAENKIIAAENATKAAESAQTFYFWLGLFVGVGGVFVWRFRKEILTGMTK